MGEVKRADKINGAGRDASGRFASRRKPWAAELFVRAPRFRLLGGDGPHDEKTLALARRMIESQERFARDLREEVACAEEMNGAGVN